MYGDVLGCWHHFGKVGNVFVQKCVVEGFDDVIIYGFLEGNQIRNHTRAGINLAFNRDFEMIVVSVPIWSCALTVDLAVFLVAQVGASKTMGGTKVSAEGEIGFHVVSVVVCPEFGVFKKLNADDRQVGGESLPDGTGDRSVVGNVC